MITVVHRIRLKAGVSPERFETWVREKDYAAAPRMDSLRSFSVHRVSSDPLAPFHYFELIAINRVEAFERDMKTPLFDSLVAAFSEMAEVVDEVQGELIEPGWRR